MVTYQSTRRSAGGQIADVLALLDHLIEESQNNLPSALDAFQELVETVMRTDPDDFATINDALLVLLEGVVESTEGLAGLLAEAFALWTGYLEDDLDAVTDLLLRLYERFADQAGAFRAMLRALVAALGDFPKLFHRLAVRTAGDLAAYRDGLESVLLPLFFGGLAVLGAEKSVEALRRVMADPAPPLGRRVTWLDMGISADGLSDWQEQALQTRAFALPAGVWMTAAMIEALRQASGFSNLLPDGLSVPNPVIQGVLGPVVDDIAQMVTGYLENVEDLLEALVARLIEGAENDLEMEWLLLQLARFTPVGLLLILVATTAKLVTSPAPWLNLVLNSIEEDPTLRVKRLPPPSDSVRYIVFSDIHRDARSDERPPYQFGSIDHFMPNRELYLELLKHYAERGYVIIEAGDCEELWFHRDFSIMPDQKVGQIIATHGEIYDLLRTLHAEGRYYRVYGNHDSYLRDPATFEVLRSAMETPGAPPFEIYDFLVIDGVKTMQDVPFFLGLDSEPNAERRPLIVTHGHQWDFWNCDANNILGKLIVSAVVTPLDMLDDPFRDLAGIASRGSPLANFKQILGDLPVFNSWQSYEPGVQRLDAVQHMEDQERRFTDDVQYSETLASLMGLLIPVAGGPADSCGFPLPRGACLFNLMSIGHTHNPHNEPYYDLKVLPYVKELLLGLQAAIATASQGLLDVELGLVKSNYLNSGVSGWYEDCIWAIDLGDESHGTGQPKLINWTHNTRIDRPNHMDWELPHVPRDGRPTPGDRLDDYLQGLLDAIVDVAQEGKERALDVLLPASTGYVAASALKSWKPVDLALGFGKGASRDAAGQLLFQCMLGLVSEERGSFRATIELPGNLAEALPQMMSRRLPGGRQSERRRLATAIGALAVIEEMGRAGLRRSVGGTPDPDGRRACLGILAVLAQLQESRADRLDVTLHLEGKRVAAKVSSGKPEGPASIPCRKPEKVSRPTNPTPEGPASKRPGDRQRGLVVKAYVAQIGTPLRDWTVVVEHQAGRQRTTLTRVRTNREGEARILRLHPTEQGLLAPGHRLSEGDLWLVLHNPAGKEVLRRKLDVHLPVSHISLPVSLPILQGSGFFGGTKGRTVEAKIADLCAWWQKRLGNADDPHGRDDLCLEALMLDTLAGLASPKTPLQREVAKTMQRVTRKKSNLEAVAEVAGKARDALRTCLGDGYVGCDGTGSLKELGERLLKENGRFAGLSALFANPVPDPEASLGEPKMGAGLPSSAIEWVKACVARFEQGEMDEELAAAMARYYPDGRVLARPSVNLIEVWDGGFGGGEVVRRTEVHDKLLNVRVLKDQGGNLAVVDRAVAMDVELDSPECLVLEADATGRQAVVTDVRPGQKVTLYGSGFVSARGTLRADYRAWEAETSSGRLVPDQNPLPADGLGNLEVEVHGQLLPLDDDAAPQTYNGDKIVFSWPEAASKQGLYRLRISFVNESDYPTSLVQNEDCSLTVTRADVQTQELCFAVLPPAQPPAVRVLGRDVECEDLTDPEGFLGIPWPDDVLFLATGLHQRLVLPGNGGEPAIENRATIARQDDTLFWAPGTWTPALRLFPENQAFAQLAALEFLLVDFQLQEVEGDLDRFLVQLLYVAGLVTLALVVAAVVVAVVVGFVAAGTITAGTAEVLLPIVLGFVFGAAFSAFLGLTAALNAAVDGSDSILSGQTQLDGSRLMHLFSPVRFHRVLWPDSLQEAGGTAPLATLDQVFDNEALGGRYTLRMLVEGE